MLRNATALATSSAKELASSSLRKVEGLWPGNPSRNLIQNESKEKTLCVDGPSVSFITGKIGTHIM